jgi:hypothetical protein
MINPSLFTVLVLCQSRKGLYEIEEKIDEFVKSKLHVPTQPYTIEYMRKLTDKEIEKGDEVDMPFNFNEDTPERTRFITKHQKYYDLIMHNICPKLVMNYELMTQILKDDGELVFTALPYNTFAGEILLTLNIKATDPFHKLFKRIPNPTNRFDITFEKNFKKYVCTECTEYYRRRVRISIYGRTHHQNQEMHIRATQHRPDIIDLTAED